MRNPRIKLMRTVWTVKAKIENSSSCALVLHMTSNLIISRRSQDDNGKEMYQNVNARAGRAKLLFLPTEYANLLRSRSRRRRPCLRSLTT